MLKQTLHFALKRTQGTRMTQPHHHYCGLMCQSTQQALSEGSMKSVFCYYVGAWRLGSSDSRCNDGVGLLGMYQEEATLYRVHSYLPLEALKVGNGNGGIFLVTQVSRSGHCQIQHHCSVRQVLRSNAFALRAKPRARFDERARVKIRSVQ